MLNDLTCVYKLCNR